MIDHIVLVLLLQTADLGVRARHVRCSRPWLVKLSNAQVHQKLVRQRHPHPVAYVHRQSVFGRSVPFGSLGLLLRTARGRVSGLANLLQRGHLELLLLQCCPLVLHCLLLHQSGLVEVGLD